MLPELAPPDISTVHDLVSAIGGFPRAAHILNAPEGTVRVWSSRGKIPARLFVQHAQSLAGVGVQAPAKLWQQGSPRRAAS